MEDGCAVGARRIIDVLSEYSRFITFQNEITVTHQAFRPTEGLSRVARPRKKTVKTKIFPKTCTIAAWRSSLYDFSVSKNEIYFYVWNDSIIMTKTWLFWVMYNRLRLKNPRVYSHRVQICISTDKPSDRMKLCKFSQILFNSIQFNFVIHQLSVSIFLNHSKFCLPEDSQCSVCRPPRLSFFIFCVFYSCFLFLLFFLYGWVRTISWLQQYRFQRFMLHTCAYTLTLDVPTFMWTYAHHAAHQWLCNQLHLSHLLGIIAPP